MQSLNRRRARRYDYVGVRDELTGRLGKSVGAFVWILDLKCNIELLPPTKFAKPLLHCFDLASDPWVGSWEQGQYTDATRFVWAVRIGLQRPGHRRTNKRNTAASL